MCHGEVDPTTVCVDGCSVVRASLRTWILASVRTCITATGNRVSVMIGTNLRAIAAMCAGPCTGTDILTITMYVFCETV